MPLGEYSRWVYMPVCVILGSPRWKHAQSQISPRARALWLLPFDAKRCTSLSSIFFLERPCAVYTFSPHIYSMQPLVKTTKLNNRPNKPTQPQGWCSALPLTGHISVNYLCRAFVFLLPRLIYHLKHVFGQLPEEGWLWGWGGGSFLRWPKRQSCVVSPRGLRLHVGWWPKCSQSRFSAKRKESIVKRHFGNYMGRQQKKRTEMKIRDGMPITILMQQCIFLTWLVDVSLIALSPFLCRCCIVAWKARQFSRSNPQHHTRRVVGKRGWRRKPISWQLCRVQTKSTCCKADGTAGQCVRIDTYRLFDELRVKRRLSREGLHFAASRAHK